MLWNRRYELKVFPVDGEQFSVGGSDSDMGYKIKFTFTRRFGGTSSDFGNLVIFNPSYNLIHSTSRGARIEFWVGWGYGTEMQLLFDGFIINSFQELVSPDMLVTIWFNRMIRSVDKVEPSEQVLKNPKPLKEVLETMVKNDFGLGLWYPTSAKNFMEQNVAPISFSSNVRESLDILKEEYKFHWSITGDSVRIVPFAHIPDTDAVVSRISIGSGMIGVPVITIAGLEVDTLIQPNIMNGETISVNSPAYSYGGDSNLSYINTAAGGNRAESVASLIDPISRNVENETRYVWARDITHTGDTRDDEWRTKIFGLHGNRQGGATL